ncbi:scaffold protein [Streptococcus phage 123]|uniref:Capsid and scaffold protein n=3 Tax=Moineauvirus TaxID=1623304 RepID=A0A3G8FB03_9CAUD|nr:capsid and scaffold protein [Streptococcus phage CHPC1091]YP_010645745.1 capsid and scaffold protein [Streptococcus phage CHPC642]YP_010648263.1 capsid and scaffold protein [Streptococcus phage vB_SthS_VA214]AXF53620.1 scaffold protein [Streptococcus phage 123]AUN43400.1 capsid and scaffold protein [Streptococcus phage vB_SthS_VA214]AZF88998.1 capsid and scaffold protein [Streptococcus phage CHPC642]AZF91945.1 capsid and scaffold protein [Streptococcus phage CHPC1091]QVW27785.1 scaffold p
MILKFFKAIWAIFDILMFILAAISLNVTTYNLGYVWFGISMTITFVLAGLVSELATKSG